MKKTYSELIKLRTFKERYEYLKIGGRVGELTFGPNRFINQRLYHGERWKILKAEIIIRDMGCDLGCDDRVIDGDIEVNGVWRHVKRPIYLHHINPVSDEDILYEKPNVYDPNNLICCSFETHQAIHYGSFDLLADTELIERTPNDTIPWKKAT